MRPWSWISRFGRITLDWASASNFELCGVGSQPNVLSYGGLGLSPAFGLHHVEYIGFTFSLFYVELSFSLASDLLLDVHLMRDFRVLHLLQ